MLLLVIYLIKINLEMTFLILWKEFIERLCK